MGYGNQQPKPTLRLLKSNRRNRTGQSGRIRKIRQSVAFWKTGDILISGIALFIIGPAYVGTVLLLFPTTHFQWTANFVIPTIVLPVFILTVTLLSCLWSKYEWHRLRWQHRERSKRFRVISK